MKLSLEIMAEFQSNVKNFTDKIKNSINDIKKYQYNEVALLDILIDLIVNSYYYNKGEVYDSVLSENIDLLEEYPILKIEYDENGTRKNMIDILKSLEYESTIHKRSDREITSISDCIFKEYYLVDDIPNLLNQLNNFVPTTEVVLQVKNQLIKELEMYNNEIANKEHIKK